MQPAGHAEVDQPGLFDPGDDLYVQVGLTPQPANQRCLVARLAHGRGGHGHRFFGAIAAGSLNQVPTNTNEALHSRGLELAGHELHLAQADHLFQVR